MKRPSISLLLILLAYCALLMQCKPKQSITEQGDSFRNLPPQVSSTNTVPVKDSADYYDRNYVRNIDHVYMDQYKTVLLHPPNAPLSPPLLFLGDSRKLRLSFDDLKAGHKEFSYKIRHCNAGWQPSELTKQEYIEGFTNDMINRSSSSENTLMEYTHYTFDFPNENFKLTRSGNYLIHVFYRDSIVLTKRFIIAENRIAIQTTLKQPTIINDRNYKQELDFVILHPAYEILDPYKSLKVVILQNHRWDYANYGIQPNFVKNNELVYDHDEVNVFEGGNEYRRIDLKNMKFKPSMISDVIVEKDGYYHVYLMDDEPRSYLRYSSMDDLNGKLLIKKDGTEDSGVEADYIYVHFSLPYSIPESTGDIYIYGQLSDWQQEDQFKMIYDYEQKKYRRTLLLKQGFYNYNYAYLEDHSKTPELAIVEGTHYETENDYSIYVYYREPGENYDRCIGVKNLNSIKKK